MCPVLCCVLKWTVSLRFSKVVLKPSMDSHPFLMHSNVSHSQTSGTSCTETTTMVIRPDRLLQLKGVWLRTSHLPPVLCAPHILPMKLFYSKWGPGVVYYCHIANSGGGWGGENGKMKWREIGEDDWCKKSKGKRQEKDKVREERGRKEDGKVTDSFSDHQTCQKRESSWVWFIPGDPDLCHCREEVQLLKYSSFCLRFTSEYTICKCYFGGLIKIWYILINAHKINSLIWLRCIKTSKHIWHLCSSKV